jgi:hypothetical protein
MNTVSLAFIKKYWEPLYENGHYSNKYSRYQFNAKLHIMDIRAVEYTNLSSILPYLADSLRYTRHLQLSNASFFTTIKPYRFSGAIMDYSSNITYFISHIPKLKSIVIQSNASINLQKCIFETLPSTIYKLDLSGVTNISDDIIHIITKHVPNLKIFKLSYAHITDISICYLKDNCHSLDTCSLSGCCNITDTGLEYMSMIHSVRIICLDLCNKITDYGITSLVKGIPTLTHISLQCTTIGRLGTDNMAIYLRNPIHINLDYSFNAQFLPLVKLRKKCKIVTNKSID